ncbi:hypothetical protein K439DRAFT_1522381 [Ramaria rubella]|nr:hypothetical protein K439DRAFT_1522381 [Ramaria rubella]
MSSVDLSDPDISMAYDAVAHNDSLRWFLLAHSSKPNVLSLHASGTGDLDELRSHILLEHICYGIFREQVKDKYLCVSLNYIPDSVKGVYRARALVHGKAVSSKFKAAEILNVSNPEKITPQTLRSILRLPPRELQGSSAPSATPTEPQAPILFSIQRKPPPDIRSFSLTVPQNTSAPQDSSDGTRAPAAVAGELPLAPNVVHDVSSLSVKEEEIYPHDLVATSSTSSPLTKIVTPEPSGPAAASRQTSSPVVTSPPTIEANSTPEPQALKSSQPTSRTVEQDTPLPPPPSTVENNNETQDAEPRFDNQDKSPHMGSIPDTGSVASLNSIGHGSPPTTPPPIQNDSLIVASPPRPIGPSSSDRGDGSPIRSNAPPTDIQKGSSSSAGRATADSPQASISKKSVRAKFHERVTSEAEAEEERKLMVLEEERRRRAAERTRREREEREEEEARERMFEERKERERLKRLQSARRAEERRMEQKRKQEEEDARKRAEQERKEAEAQQRRNHIQQRFANTGMDLLTGFITLESASHWKRRYYRLSTEDWTFFKNDEETTAPLLAIELSRVRALREWNEGYDELEAIPHSFAVELKEEAPWLFFADSAEDKEILLGLLNQAAGL